MKKLLTILLFSPLFLKAQISIFGWHPVLPVFNTTTKIFTFHLDTASATSAGIYALLRQDVYSVPVYDTVLIRTLWSNIRYTAGDHDAQWDGKDDQGNFGLQRNYFAQVTSNNIQSQWEGGIGNTSDSMSNSTHMHAYNFMQSMAVGSTYTYYAAGYNEQLTSAFKFLNTDPQKKIEVGGKDGDMHFVALDATNTYWAVQDANHKNNNFVIGRRQSDDREITFTNGYPVTVTFSNSHASAIDLDTSAATGLAVSGNYIFVAHATANKITIWDKNTGALVSTFSISSPKALAATGSYLWVTSGTNTVTKYLVGGSGIIGSSSATITGLTQPIDIKVKPTDDSVYVADITGEIKSYGNTSGAYWSTYGQADGYYSSATVQDNKFYFHDLRGTYPGGISFAPDGSFWVIDYGNNRSLHFSTNRGLIEKVAYLGVSYSCAVDYNNPTRVFSDYLEFSTDYTKTLGTAGSWTLVKNWGAKVTPFRDNKYGRLKGIATLSNGRTYAATPYPAPGNFQMEIVELTSADTLRYTGARFPNDNTQLYPDGSLRYHSTAMAGTPVIFTRRTLTGFSSNNPQWGAAVELARTPTLQANDAFGGDANNLTSGEVTASGKYVLFGAQNKSSDYHLETISPLGQFTAKTARNTDTAYTGDFPSDGWYDMGNINGPPDKHINKGSKVYAIGNTITQGYYGEFWKNSQTNKFNLFNENGLHLSTFGVTGLDATGSPTFQPFPGMAGNAFAYTVVKSPIDTNTLYFYHPDESFHSMVHRWKVWALNTNKTQTVPLNSGTITSPLQFLTSGLFGHGVLLNSNGWQRSGTEDYTSQYSQYWSVKYGLKSYDPFSFASVTATYRKPAGNKDSVWRTLPTITGNYGLNGLISFEGNTANSRGLDKDGSFLRLLDASNKSILELYMKDIDGANWQVVANGQVLVTGTVSAIRGLVNHFQSFTVLGLGSTLNIDYAGYSLTGIPKLDTSAGDPATLKMFFHTDAGGYNAGRQISIKDMSIQQIAP